MTKQEFMSEVDLLEKRLRWWRLSFGQESFCEFCIGYFFDEEENKWKVFVHRDRSLHSIVLTTENEAEVYDKVLAIIREAIRQDEWLAQYGKEGRKGP